MERDVEAFVEECAKIVGVFEGENFKIEAGSFTVENNISSPIEELFYNAFAMLVKLNYLGDLIPDIIELDGTHYISGIELRPQEKIGKYRVDFLAIKSRFNSREKKQFWKEVIVECDSQEFHEKTEKERRYEKARDRFLQSKGYKIFHYTGKEIMENPIKIASEVLGYITDISPINLFDINYMPEKYAF